MKPPFKDDMSLMADSMGIALYQRFTMQEASLFLRCPLPELKSLIKNHQIEFIQVTQTEVQLFGYQLLQHLINNVVATPTLPPPSHNNASGDHPERILRTKEVIALVGVSRSTLWRMETKGQFPARVPIGTGSVGWLKSDIDCWLKEKK